MLEPTVTGEFSPHPELQLARLAPPPARAALLPRLRVDQLLARAAETPLTVLAAPAGFGKTIALGRLARRGGWPSAWCRLHPEDTPQLLAHHIVAACAPALAGAAGQRSNDDPSGARALARLLNQLATDLEDDTLLILDDYHHADQRPALRALIERLASNLPARLHLVLSTRQIPELDAFAYARARGDLLLLGLGDLAMTVGEAHALFGLAGLAVPSNLSTLHTQAAGWPIALRLLVEDAPRQVSTAKGGLSYTPLLPTLERFIAHEILGPLPTPLQDLMLDASALRQFDRAACAALVRDSAPPDLLDLLERTQLIAPSGGDGPFCVPLLAESLRRAAAAQGDQRAIHRKLALHYRQAGQPDEALEHLFAAGDLSQAALLLQEQAGPWLASGRADQLLSWVARLPEEQRGAPDLLLARAAAARRMGQFERALADYALAEQRFLLRADDQGRAQALRGQAEIYLDIVQPAPAVGLLKQALKLLPRDRAADRSALLRMQAENWANRGRADVALLLEQAARRIIRAAPAPTLMPAPPAGQVAGPLPPRLLLRAGRLAEARAQLEQELGLDPRPERPRVDQPLHREPQLLLAFIDVLLGNGARALGLARRGLLESQQGGSRLTEAIAHMRLGHALQIIAPRDQGAHAAYERGLALVQAAGVARTRAEAYLGLTLLHGHGGDMAAAELAAQSGQQLAEAAGDAWMSALIGLALGGSAVAAADPRGPGWIAHARALFQRGHDTYGQAVASLWLAIDHLRHGRTADLTSEWRTLLALIERYGYYGLFTSPTLFGPRDLATLIPLLLHGRSAALRDSPPAQVVEQILRHAYPAIAADELVETYHPGFTLRVQLLGGFRVWRGAQEIQSREWQREKSRQLLQMLLNQRGQWLQREQICAWLWPDASLEAAERQFKVTLNALNVALEPRRPPRTPPFFIRRQGLAYSFAPSYGCWIDVDEFELRLSGPPQPDPDLALRNSRSAIQLYQGDYLPELLYEPWTVEERERLLARYLAAATSFAAQLYARGDYAETIEQCEQIIRRDRCYEEAYQILMRAHTASGSRSQALRAFTRCAQSLESELGIEPLPETYMLHERIRQNQPIDGAEPSKSL